LFAEIKGITTTQGDCGLFFKLDGQQKETLYYAFSKSLKRKVSVKEESAWSKCAVS
jgi:hypothetical protein